MFAVGLWIDNDVTEGILQEVLLTGVKFLV